MELMTITQVTKELGVSTRMLRYYEQIGLIQSRRREDYSYRVYDEETCMRLRQIIILRRLRIPLRQIGELLEKRDVAVAIEVFMENIDELDDEIAALSTVREILKKFVDDLREKSGAKVKLDLLSESSMLELIESLSPMKSNLKEEKSMDDLKKATEELSKLKDVRIVYLPPATVAASHYIGEEPERHAGDAMEKFIRDVKLWEMKPDMRSYGFNHPNEVKGTDQHGYEFWTTIPDDLEVPEPLTKKKFPGGLYAAHVIQMGDFHEWEWLWKWVESSPEYDFNTVDDGGECMNGLLEECLNYPNVVRQKGIAGYDEGKVQLDLLIPIRSK